MKVWWNPFVRQMDELSAPSDVKEVFLTLQAYQERKEKDRKLNYENAHYN